MEKGGAWGQLKEYQTSEWALSLTGFPLPVIEIRAWGLKVWTGSSNAHGRKKKDVGENVKEILTRLGEQLSLGGERNGTEINFHFLFLFLMWDFRFQTRDWTCTPAVEAWSLNHWTSREVPFCFLSENWLLLLCQLFGERGKMITISPLYWKTLRPSRRCSKCT